MVDQELEAALCAPDWATSLTHVHNAQAALAAERAKVEKLREALVQADLKIRSFSGADQSDVEFIRAALTETQP